MTKEQFMEKILEGLKMDFSEEEYQLQGNVFCKNNDTIRYGIIIKKKKQNIAPTIYLDNFYKDYQDKKVTIGEILETIKSVYEGTNEHLREYESLSMDFEECKSKIIYRLVSQDLNSQYLEDIPHVPFLNMAITFHVVCKLSEEGIEALCINNSLMKHWNKNIKDLFWLAEKNTPKILPLQIEPMASFIMNYMGFDKEDFPHNPIMLIATNRYRLNGAAVLLYKDLIHNLAEKYESNLIILPSSIHEIIVVPENKVYCPLEEYSEMVKEINEKLVSKDEILANNAYLYDWKEKKFVIS